MREEAFMGKVNCLVLIVLCVGWSMARAEGPATRPVVEVARMDDMEMGVARAPFWPPTTRPSHHHAYLDRVVSKVQGKMSLEEFVKLLRDASGVNVVAEWKVIEAAGVERTTTVELDLKDVTIDRLLLLGLEEAGGGSVCLGYWASDNIITITTAEALGTDGSTHPAVVRVYNVRDIIVDAARFGRSIDQLRGEARAASNGSSLVPHSEEEMARELRQIILDGVEPNSWTENGGKYATIHYVGGLFVICQHPSNHDQILAILRLMRESAGQPKRAKE
jgi:hypothetical protein